MSTNKESTLQIKDYRGINRFELGTTTPPNEFFTLQNWHPKSRAELESLKGVLNQTPNALPGVGTFVHVDFLEQTFGDRKLIALFKPNISHIPVPVVTAGNFVTTGGSAQTMDLYVRYVGPGGAISQVLIPAYPLETTTTFTLPTGVDAPPDYVAEIQIYAKFETANPDNAAFCCAIQRRSGSFVANISFISPYPYIAVIGDDAIPSTERIATAVTTFKCIPLVTTGGTLEGGRTYYFGLAPWVIDGTHLFGSNDVSILTDVTLYDSGSKVLAYTLPEGYNSVKVLMSGMSANLTSPPAVTPVAIDYFLLFMGQTPEDMQLAETTAVGQSGVLNGRINPVLRSRLTGGTCLITGQSYNNSLNVQMHKWNSISGGGVDVANWESGDNLGSSETRLYGVFRNIMMAAQEGGDLSDNQLMNQDLCQKMSTAIYGAYVIPALPIVPNNCWQLLPTVPSRSFAVPPVNTSEKSSGRIFAAFPVSPNTQFTAFYQNGDDILASRNYSNRMTFTNGLNTPFYTNGYCFKPWVRKYVDSTIPAQHIPITKYVEVLNDRMIYAGGNSNFANTDGQVFYSESGVPYNFGGATWNTLNANRGETSDIVGLGIYSPDLSTVGPQNHLVIGKKDSILTWTGSVDTGAQVLDRVSGFAGPRAITRTNLGTIIFGRDNIYLMQSGTQVIPFGYEVQSIVQSIPDNLLKYVNILYSEARAKIAYTTTQPAVMPTVGTSSAVATDGTGTYTDGNVRSYRIYAVCELYGVTISSQTPSTSAEATGGTLYGVAVTWPVATFPAGSVNQRYVISSSPAAPTNYTRFVTVTGAASTSFSDTGDGVWTLGQPVLGAGFVPVLDRELILELRLERGGVQKFYSGPHILKEYVGQGATVSFNSELNTRVSFLGPIIYQRDIGNLNDLANIARKIVISRLGLEADHFWKVLRSLYLAVRLRSGADNEVFTITLDQQQGSSQYTQSQSTDFSLGSNDFVQINFPTRVIGRVNQVTIDDTSANELSLVDISLLYQVLKRRQLRSSL